MKEPRSKIDLDSLRKLLRHGLSTREIADRFGTKPPAVISFCHRHHLPLPGSGAAAVMEKQETRDKTFGTGNPRRADLIATGGRYRDLERFAEKWGTTQAKALVEWRSLGRPVEARSA